MQPKKQTTPKESKLSALKASKLGTRQVKKTNPLQECQKLRDEYLAGWQRAKADFENYKKEESARIKNALNFAKAGWVFQALSVYDNLQRAKAHTPKELKENEWVKGVEQIESQFKAFLKEQGVERIDPQGEKFDPNFHQAVEEVGAENTAPGTVVEVLEKGYSLNGQVLRPAKVKVAK